MLKKIILAVLLLMGIFLIYVAFIPGEYNIKREIIIDSPATNIFPYLVNVKKADEWMPWKEQDPQLVMTYSGSAEGKGAMSSWDSKGNMGQGKAEIIEVIPNQKVITKISFVKPMEFQQMSYFSLQQISDKQTTMTWSVEGKNTYISRLVCTIGLVNMDKYVGNEFEKGLKKLKNIVELAK